MSGAHGILFTAFEPSGDEHAAAVIRALRQLRPELTIWALGGPRMAQAGAQLLESSTGRAVMLAGALSQAWVHHRRVKRLDAWLREHRVEALVPVDSPAANWSICRLLRRRQPQARILHLVAPQLWAWAPWRIGKLRRLSDHVLCLLPFEPAWFEARGVKASFVGHPLFDDSQPRGSPLDLEGQPRVALLPGSRLGEIRANWPTMRRALEALSVERPALRAVVAAASDTAAELVRRLTPRWPRPLEMLTGRADDVLAWCDLALVVSGTATLQVAAHGKPMVALYNVNRLGWHLAGRWLIQTRTFTLPNLLAEAAGQGRAVCELVPHFRQVEPVARELRRLMDEPALAAAQRQALARIAHQFTGQTYGRSAAAAILKMLEKPEEIAPQP